MKEGKVKDVQELSREVNDMRKELDSMKEVVRGLLEIMMSREEYDDGDEYN
ncbi:hypothetical protein [Picrophilus oshimae]|uniref:Uncharacterized protein n=1 Tax=Picrophilus torridus (strain ATCC 700027 / DSM 9790 / JCM 10055 / NBRC 100828 / KAW 2/3) TaxID=1122961 RepID=Q6L145_PICTO|nr:hypothetical protein [Picrophilus oshimae]AAT43307.1 hypothetical protein PTO0722 [Picrophilus oshimae DSM 9789]SMD30385.1 hypothetical protein SAMN02745355_0264 [Picrophilus oshimae DSM 9789]